MSICFHLQDLKTCQCFSKAQEKEKKTPYIIIYHPKAELSSYFSIRLTEPVMSFMLTLLL